MSPQLLNDQIRYARQIGDWELEQELVEELNDLNAAKIPAPNTETYNEHP